MNTYYIYVLRCPQTNKIRYVGCTQFPAYRQREHCIYAIKEPKTKLQQWLCGLRSQGQKPVFEIVDSFQANILTAWKRGKEATWIQDCREQGCDLLNVAWNRAKG